jgi:hypothetical protein
MMALLKRFTTEHLAPGDTQRLLPACAKGTFVVAMYLSWRYQKTANFLARAAFGHWLPIKAIKRCS